jgi:hypothetical protein
VAAWPAAALTGLYELLMVIIRSAHIAAVPAGPNGTSDDNPLHAQDAEVFADDLAADRVPSIQVIRARLRVGQPRAQRVRAYLADLSEG